MSKLVSFGPHKKQYFKHFDRSGKSVLVLIHGGAWRDVNNTMDDFDKWGEYLKEYDIFSLDYRLAPEFQHPCQLEDVISALNLITKTTEAPITLCGHSVGATLICQLIELGKFYNSIKSVILMDGIYSMKDLLNRYPSYEGFVVEEFGNLENTYLSMAIDKNISAEMYKGLQIKIVYSNQDELLSWETSEYFINWLKESCIEVETLKGDFGVHNDVYESLHVADLITR